MGTIPQGITNEDVHGPTWPSAAVGLSSFVARHLPCYKLALRFGRDDMIERFLASGRSGFYLSVIEPGEVRAGSSIEVLSRDPHRVTIADISALFLNETHEPDLLERAIKVSALPQNWKVQLRLRARSQERSRQSQ